MESNQPPFTQMFITHIKKKNNDMTYWLYNTISKNELLSPLPIEIWEHIMTFVSVEPRTYSHKFALQKWLYNNEDCSIPVHPGKLLKQVIIKNKNKK